MFNTTWIVFVKVILPAKVVRFPNPFVFKIEFGDFVQNDMKFVYKRILLPEIRSGKTSLLKLWLMLVERVYKNDPTTWQEKKDLFVCGVVNELIFTILVDRIVVTSGLYKLAILKGGLCQLSFLSSDFVESRFVVQNQRFSWWSFDFFMECGMKDSLLE